MSYDLEEQDQIEQLRAFWQRWGNLISLLALAAALSWAGYTGWQWWSNRQAAQAAQLYGKLSQDLQATDLHNAAPVWAALQNEHAATPYSAMAGLALARAQADAGQGDAAIQTLNWVVGHAGDSAYQAAARLDLAALQMDSHQLDAALTSVKSAPAPEFEALFAMRRGDIYALQGDNAQARSAYQQALSLLPPASSYRQLLQFKLDSVGGQA